MGVDRKDFFKVPKDKGFIDKQREKIRKTKLKAISNMTIAMEKRKKQIVVAFNIFMANLYLILILIGLLAAVILSIFLVGVFRTTGEMPYSLCGGEGSAYSKSDDNSINVLRTKDTYTLPVDYSKAEKDYNGTNYKGEDSDTSKGFIDSGNADFQSNTYSISGRWNYNKISIQVNEGQFSNVGNKTQDKIREIISSDARQKDWISKQKILIENPENGKKVIAQVGDGANDPMYKDGNLNTTYKLNNKVKDALGEIDYNKELNFYFVQDTTEELGPTEKAIKITTGKIYNYCSGSGFGGIGNANIAEAAASLADPNYFRTHVLTGKSHHAGYPGLEIYQRVCELTDAGRPDNCIGAVQAIIKFVGADPNFPRRDPDWYINGSRFEKTGGSNIPGRNYFEDRENLWVEIDFKGDESLLEPGDIFMSPYLGTYSHTLIYTGSEIMKKYHPELGDEYKYAEASYSSYGLIARNKPGNLHMFRAFRNINQTPDEKYKNILNN